MSRTVFNLVLLAAFTLPLGGCGLAQTVADGTASTAKAIFYKQVNTLHLDFSARTALNTDATDMRALSVPTLVRVYQLRDSKAVELATYEGLLGDDERLARACVIGQTLGGGKARRRRSVERADGQGRAVCHVGGVVSRPRYPAEQLAPDIDA